MILGPQINVSNINDINNYKKYDFHHTQKVR